MANPQKENGYTAIANEIMDALCKCHPGGSEGQVLLAVIRQTFGWNKKEDRLSISQLCNITSLARRTVIYAIKNLEAKNMITIKRASLDGVNEINVIGFQKDHGLWVVQEIDGSARKCQSYRSTIRKQKENYKAKVVQEIDSSARKCQKVVQEIENLVPFLAPTKDTITKDNKQKTKALFILPDFISKETWDAYKEMRQRKRAPLTDRAASLIVKELEKLKAQGHDPEAVLNQSIMKSWTGVFPVSTASGGGNGGNGKHIGNAYTPRQYGRNSTVSDRTDAALDRVIEEAERVRKSTVSNSIRNAEGDDVPDAIMQRI